MRASTDYYIRHFSARIMILVLHIASRGSAQAAECGIGRKEVRNERIVGGTQAAPGEFPWQVAVFKRGHFACAASVIDEAWVVTAAHCADLDLGSYYLLFGKEELLPFEKTQQMRAINKIRIHPNYSLKTMEYDVALMRLSEPLIFTDYIAPVCLPEVHEDYTNLTCTATGWGYMEKDKSPARLLQKVDLPIWSNKDCAAIHEHYKNVSDATLCAGYRGGGRSICYGDSGGPLVCRRTNAGWVLIGISSWVDICAAPNQPAVFVRVTSVVNWVLSTTRDHN
ncbi:prostasin-like [Ornithodoros turicata]|uniref:prostasin-like n=1 Tax=Ornithodoros turicata TaxID=34597 RepID=UPI003139C6B8